MVFRKAEKSDIPSILALYDSVKGSEFCVWNEHYPTEFDANIDLSSDRLFVLCDGEKLIGAASAVSENELDGLVSWKFTDAAEIARIVIAPDMQKRKLSEKLVGNLLCKLKEQGVMAVHLSVVKKNIPALKCYKALGFEISGEYEMYGNSYFLCEKEL